jgi:hypothetical protein
METDTLASIELASDLLHEAPSVKVAAVQMPPEAGEDDLLKTFVRVIFERELQAFLKAGEAEPIDRVQATDPLDEVLNQLIGRYFPRCGRVASFVHSRLRRGLNTYLLGLRVRREFYRTIYRFVCHQEAPDRAWGQDEIGDPILRGKFYTALAYFLGGQCSPLDLGQLDRLVGGVVDWCLSILPYHAPGLSEQDLNAILEYAQIEIS